MRRKLLLEISNQIVWEIQEIELAIDKIKTKDSIINDWDNFFSICISSEEPVYRWLRVSKLVNEILSRMDEKELIELMSKWIYNLDPLYDVCLVFNMAFYRKERGSCRSLLEGLQQIQSFTLEYNQPFQQPIYYGDYLLDRYALCDRSIDMLFNYEIPNNRATIHPIMCGVIEKSGFNALNYSIFNQYASICSFNPAYRKYGRSIAQSLMHLYSKSEKTEETYWMYFVLVEKFKDHGYKPMQAYREVAKLVENSESKIQTIKSRYNERKRRLVEIRKSRPSYNLDQIIRDNNLESTIANYSKEIMSVDLSVTQR